MSTALESIEHISMIASSQNSMPAWGCMRLIGVHDGICGCMKVFGVHGSVWGAWKCMGCMEVYGVHGSVWGAWKCMGCMKVYGVHESVWGARWVSLEDCMYRSLW